VEIETFETTEVGVEGKIENFEESKGLCEKLGLEGQKEFFNEEKKEIIPYRKITAQEKLVYETILPTKHKLKDYSDGVIPLRVLQVAAHAIELGICTVVEVWHQPNGDVKDPLLVGKADDKYSTEYFILARWGEILEPFNKLAEIAKKILIAEYKGRIQKVIHEAKQFECTLEAQAERAILTGKGPSISCYISD